MGYVSLTLWFKVCLRSFWPELLAEAEEQEASEESSEESSESEDSDEEDSDGEEEDSAETAPQAAPTSAARDAQTPARSTVRPSHPCELMEEHPPYPACVDVGCSCCC